MAKYKVIALSVGSSKGTVYNSGDVVTDEDFDEGEAEEYVKSKHLKPLKEKAEKEETGTAGGAGK